MTDNFPMTHAELIKRGYLVDVSEYAKLAGFNVPIAVSFTLWEDYISHPSRSVSTSQNILNTLFTLHTNITSGQIGNVARFTMVYPSDDGMNNAHIVAMIAPDEDQQVSGVLFLNDDVDE